MTDDFLRQFGNAIRYYRLNADMSQEELAEASGLHRTYVGAVERGERNISLRNVKRLAVSLRVDVRDLFEKRQ
jgi:transcriptional regulator with XRE-family HTH domain